jgi:carbon storage regulator
MLVLSRKVGEQIIIGDNIRLEVVSVRGSRVQLGITAPREVPVQREELRINSDLIPALSVFDGDDEAYPRRLLKAR